MIRTFNDGRLKPIIDLPGFEDIKLTPRINDIVVPILHKIAIHGIGNPIRSIELETYFTQKGVHGTVSGPSVRKVISHARLCGYPVGSCSKGYFWATTREEIQTTIDHLRGRAAAINAEADCLELSQFHTKVNNEGQAELVLGSEIRDGLQ